MYSYPSSCHSPPPLRSKYFPQHPATPSVYVLPLVCETKFQTHIKQVKLYIILIFMLLERRREDKRF